MKLFGTPSAIWLLAPVAEPLRGRGRPANSPITGKDIAGRDEVREARC